MLEANDVNLLTQNLCGLLVLVLVLVLVLGCGSSTVSQEDFVSEVCRAHVACGKYPSIESCMAIEDTNSRAELAAIVDAGRADYHADQASRCVDAITGFSRCERIFGPEMSDAVGAECTGVLTGNVEVGGECIRDAECADDGTCEIPDCQQECCVGTCVAGEPEPARVAAGDDCSQAQCIAGTYCGSTVAEPRCFVDDAEGEPCSGYGGDGTCEAGLICTGVGSTCTRPAAAGEACDPQLPYAFMRCARSDNWCDPFAERCKPRVPPGERCSYTVEKCVEYAYCGDTGFCKARPVSGETCGGSREVPCLRGYDCIEAVCVLEEPDPICTI